MRSLVIKQNKKELKCIDGLVITPWYFRVNKKD